MANSIINRIITRFSNVGADESAGAADRVGRAQTRLGNSSAGAGRQFAAQSSGLGGLVAAYAGAAATSFALTAAFEALANASRAAQTVAGLNTLAASSGQNGAIILENISKITKGQLSIAATAEQVNLALSAGFNTNQIEGIATVAAKASKVLGRDLADSMIRLTRGSAKMEAELLDELGIYTKIAPATAAYAAAIGKTTSSLTEYERRQAFVNAVITEGTRKFGMINTSIPTTADTFQKLAATLQNLTTSFLGFIADALAPVANFITSNVAASFGLLGIVLSMVASKGISIFSTSMEKLVKDMRLAGINAEDSARKFLGLQKAAAAASKSIAERPANLMHRGMSKADKKNMAALQETAGTRNLTRAEFAESNKLIQQNIQLHQQSANTVQATVATKTAALATERANIATVTAALQQHNAAIAAAQAMPKGKFGDPVFTARTQAIRAATRALQQVEVANATAIASEKQLSRELNIATQNFNRHTAAINADTAALGRNKVLTTSIRATLSSAGRVIQTGFAGAVGGIAKVAGGVASVASGLFFWVSMIQLAGSALASLFGKTDVYNAFFTGLGQKIKDVLGFADKKQVKEIAIGVTSGTLQNLMNVQTELKNIDSFTFKESKVLGIDIKISKTKEDLANEVAGIMTDVTNDTGNKTWADSLKSWTSIGGAIVLGGLGAFFGPGGVVLGATLGASIGAGLGTAIDHAFNGDTSAMEATVAKYGEGVKQRFSVELGGMDAEVQKNAIAALSKLEEIYSTRSTNDPSARIAKKLQEQLILGGIQATTSIAGITQVMQSTGKAADEVVKAFDFTPAVNQVDYIDQAVTMLAGKKITFKFIDDMDESFTTLFDQMTHNIDTMPTLIGRSGSMNIFGSEQTYSAQEQQSAIDELTDATIRYRAAGMSAVEAQQLWQAGSQGNAAALSVGTVENIKNLMDSVISVGSAFKSAQDSVNLFQRGTINGVALTEELSKGITNNNLTLEQFSQKMGDATSSLRTSARAYGAAIDSVNQWELITKSLEKEDPNSDIAKKAREILKVMQEQTASTKVNLELAKEQLAVEKSREGILKNSITLSDFYKSFKKDPKNQLSVELDFVQVGMNPLEQFDASLAYLEQFKKATIAQTAAYEVASRTLDTINLAPEEKSAILGSATIEELQVVIGQMKDVKLTMRDLGHGETQQLVISTTEGLETVYNLLVDSSGKIVNMNKDALAAQQEIIRQAIESLPAVMDAGFKEFKTISENFKKEMADIGSKEIVAKIKFEADITGLQASLDQQMKQNAVTRAAADLKVTQSTRAEPLPLTMSGAKLGLAQKDLITAQVDASKKDYDSKIALIDAQAKASKEALEAETNLQLQKLKDDLAYVSRVSQLAVNTSNLQIEAGDRVGEAILQGFNQGAEVISSALGAFGGIVNTQTYIAPPLKEYEALAATVQASAIDYAKMSTEAQLQVEDLRDAKIAAIDANAEREKGVLIYSNINQLYSEYSTKFNADYNTLVDIVAKEQQRTQELQDQLEISKMQYAIDLAQANNKLADTNTANRIAGAEQQLQLGSQQLSNLQATNSIEIQRIKNNNELLDVQAQIANIKGSGNAAQDKAQLEGIQNQTKLNAAQYELVRMERDVSSSQAEIEAKKRANLELEKQILIDNYNNQVAAIKASGSNQAAQTKIQLESLDRQSALIDTERRAKVEEHAQALDQFNKETILMLSKIQADIVKNENDRKIIEDTKNLDLARVAQQRAAGKQDYDNTMAQITAIDVYWRTTTSFIDGIKAFGIAVAEFLLGQGKDVSTVRKALDNLPDMSKAPDTTGAKVALSNSQMASTRAFDAQVTSIEDIAKANLDNNSATKAGLEQQFKYTSELRELQRQGLITQQQAEIMAFTHEKDMIDLAKERAKAELAAAGGGTAAQLAQAKATFDQTMQGLNQQAEDLAYTVGKIGPILKSIKEGIGSSFTDALVGLNASLFDTTDTVISFGERLRDAFFGIMKGIEEQVFKETIANPIGTFIADWVGKNVLGKIATSVAGNAAGDATGAAANATGAAANAAAVSAAAATVSTAYTTAGTTVAVAATAGIVPISTAGVTIAGGITTLAATVTAAASAALIAINIAKASSTVGSTIGSAITTLVAGGGMIHRAGGGSVPGYASGNMVRDRVPAMLEPGEFVLRKQAASAIGVPALQAMNAGGAAGGNVVVNIKNEGTPQEATASKPRFDGEKFVIDIITRDLSNNGPIRRSMRAGI